MLTIWWRVHHAIRSESEYPIITTFFPTAHIKRVNDPMLIAVCKSNFNRLKRFSRQQISHRVEVHTITL